jgi:hypothetical protein
MNPLEEFTVIFLTLFDHIMDVLTLGWWSIYRGDEIVLIKTSKQN